MKTVNLLGCLGWNGIRLLFDQIQGISFKRRGFGLHRLGNLLGFDPKLDVYG